MSPDDFTSLPFAILPLSVVFAAFITFVGHSRLFETIIVGSVMGTIGLTFLILEIFFFILTPFRLLFGEKPSPKSFEETGAEASGKRDILKRRIVFFDGICVLCNRAGQFVVAHLPDRNAVSFVPIQDALANPHVSLARIQQEFPELERPEMISERICVVSGDKMYWGADAVMEVCSWMYLPFPILKLGYIIPRPIRNFVYSTVSSNRYEWFGTQPLDNNFSKSLCPYIQVRRFLQTSGTKRD